MKNIIRPEAVASLAGAGWLADSEISILNSELPFHGRKLRRQKEPRRENLAEINSRKKEAWG